MLIKLPLLKIKDWRKEIRNRKLPIEERKRGVTRNEAT